MSDEFYTYFRLKIPQILARGAAHLMDRYIPRHADFIIAINRPVANYLIEHGVPADKIKFIPPGIDFGGNLPDPDPALRRKLNLGDGPLILYVGNLDGYQRMDLLLDALPEIFSRCAEARLLLLTGSDSEPLMRSAHERGFADRITVAPHPPFDKVREIMALGTVAVNPRVSWSGFPIKLLNYMAARLPVVAFSGAAAPITHEVNGLLVPAEDTRGFASAVIRLLEEPVLAQRLGFAGAEIVRKLYSWDKISADIERIYYKIITQ
jgi:glycosyltransferase involved in cell wall biosynthesis